MNTMFKKMACFLPGLGTPVSLYYAFTNKELRGTALKGLAILPAAVIVLFARPLTPSPLALLAGAYIYWGLMALAGGWGFLVMFVAWRAIETNVMPIEPIEQETPELIPTASVSEVIPDLDASALLSGIERLPEEERQELVKEIIQKVKVEEGELLKRHQI